MLSFKREEEQTQAQVKQSIRTIYLQFSTEQVQLKIYRIKN